MDDRTRELVVALTTAFPPVAIERETIDEAGANLDDYDDRTGLEAFEGKAWVELPADLLIRHPTLPVLAGAGLFHAIAPAYLRHVLLEQERFDELPFQLARQLTRSDDPAYQDKFDERAPRFTAAQRAVVRDTLAHLSSRVGIDKVMAGAVPTWNRLLETPDDA